MYVFYLMCRKAGGGFITPHVQKFILENCTDTDVNDLLSSHLVKFTQTTKI